MKITQCLVGEKVVLVPYLREHVPKYHEWMQNSYIQEMTESEPLTLDEEYEMQQEWRRDEQKCTFIVIEKSLNPYFNLIQHNNNENSTQEELLKDSESHSLLMKFITHGMCGDVNLFLHSHFEPEEHRAEIEVMIAEESARRKGIASEAVQLMMEFGHSELQLQIFEAKILETNHASIQLFENRLKFKRVKYQQVFQEYVFEYHYKKKEIPSSQVDWNDTVTTHQGLNSQQTFLFNNEFH
ncbi:hypothetical protein C9374_008415 [Naegleria lovaniensis]|uniref:N-acetyltransferase domain-containing protein n=1 Tax=Naegleria lovaniensis TaxID=51637 RepID=A0AA88GJ26_NAELO|nr:uncharacterized protein C9374_008415 [Naegleria lovaniensis]KAG2378272.1 hypothetical protein C9374_008415 [Naegleria lovaniensis]